MGRMRVWESQVAGSGSTDVARGSALARATTALLVLFVALLAFGQTAASASGPGGAVKLPASAYAGKGAPAAARAHELGYSLTPSTTEPYLACPAPAPHHYACLAVIIPPAVARSHSLVGALSESGPQAASPLYEGSGEKGGLAPNDLRSAYGISATGGSGQTIAIVDAFDDPKAEADLETYRSHYGLSPCTKANGCFKKVNEKGEEGKYPPEAKKHWGLEISLDLDMASAVCAECHILLVEANNTEVGLPFDDNVAAGLGATEISNSWGGEEYSAETSEDHYFDHPGIPITVAAGDFGYGASYPATSPYVISVGGTRIKLTKEFTWEQSVWSGSGSGCSEYESKPTWQTDTVCQKRTDNDTAAVAAPESPVSIYDSYYEPGESPGEGWELVGGTSASAPILAAIEAHASKSVKEEGPEAFYRHNMKDILKGSTLVFDGCRSYLCGAQPGYDGPTGWGVPQGPMTEASTFSAVTSNFTNISSTTVTLNGYVYPEGKATTYQFEYGKTVSYGSKAPATPASAGSGAVWKAVSQGLTGLEQDTTYHYRLVATNSSGTVYGADRTFGTVGWGVQSNPSAETANAELLDASCTTTSACTAVGQYGVVPHLALVEHWNGREWQIQSTPPPSESSKLDSELRGVSCSSASACVAVGRYEIFGSIKSVLAYRWSEAGGWKLQETPALTGALSSELDGVSCPSAISCTAIGSEQTSEGERPLAEHWSEAEGWKVQETSSLSKSKLASLSCSTTACVAVGRNNGLSVAAHWNASEGWKIQNPPNPEGTQEASLSKVSCASSLATCTAVGDYDIAGGSNDLTLAESWSESEGWKVESTPSPSGGGALRGVSCASSSACTAVGIDKSEGPFEESWTNQEGWKLHTLPVSSETSSDWVSGVSCVSLQVCVAVGYGGGNYHTGALLERERLATAGTEAASTVIVDGAVLNGKVNPEENDTHYHFEYGTTLSYGTSTPEVDVGAATNGQAVSSVVRGLTGSTTYHYRLVATNAAGIVYGEDKTFTTTAVEWRLGGASLSESVLIGWKGKLKLRDTSNSAAVECEVAAEGLAIPPTGGEVTKWTMSKCVGSGTCESSGATVEPLHLSWATELVKSGEAIRDWIAAPGHGEPGFKMKCKVLGLSFTAECTAPLVMETAMTNVSTGVNAEFLTSPKLNCNGESGVGVLEGTQTIIARNGGKLSAVNASEAAKLSEAEWHLGGAKISEPVSTGWKGSVKLTDSLYSYSGLECEETGEGLASPTNVGEVTKLTMSKCAAISLCETSTNNSMTAVGLPWHSELAVVAGVTRDVLTGSGHGEPQLTMKCKLLGALDTIECKASALSMSTTNGSTGVTAAFIASEKVVCGYESNEGLLEGTQTITASKGGKLEVAT